MAKEDKRGAPLVDGEGMAAILMVQDSVNLGPGKPGPGDEWKFPTESSEPAGSPEAETTEATGEPSSANGSATGRPGFWQRLTRRG